MTQSMMSGIDVNKVEEALIFTTNNELIQCSIEVGKMTAKRVRDVLENSNKTFIMFTEISSQEEVAIHKDSIVFMVVTRSKTRSTVHGGMKTTDVTIELKTGTQLSGRINMGGANTVFQALEKNNFIPMMDVFPGRPESVLLVNKNQLKLAKEGGKFHFKRDIIGKRLPETIQS